MDETTAEIYNSIMMQQEMALYGRDRNSVSDEEDFVTSKEIVKERIKIKSAIDGNGIVPPGGYKIEETVHFKRYGVGKQHKYTDSELKRIRESCAATIVHDYSEDDIYHISEEELQRRDVLFEMTVKLGGLRKTYRRADQYVEAMRIIMEAWKAIESSSNFVHSKKEFYQWVSDGRIVSSRIVMPKLKRMNQYDLDTLITYTSNPELDASDLAPKENNDIDPYYDEWEDLEKDEEAEDELRRRIFASDEFKHVQDIMNGLVPTIEVENIKSKDVKGYDRRVYSRKKKNKKLSKKQKRQYEIKRYMQKNLHNILNTIQSNPANYNDIGRSYMVTHSMFEPAPKEKDPLDELRFTGSWTNDTEVLLHDLYTRELMMDQIIPGTSGYKTYGDKELKDFFDTLEKHGVNVMELRRAMNMTHEAITSRDAKHIKKNNRRAESRMIDRIAKLSSNPKFKKLIAKAENDINAEYADT